MKRHNFIAIDFETATGRRNSVCEVGIAVVRDSQVVETRSWLVRPPRNEYNWHNIEVHGITPQDTENSPEFSDVWVELRPYLEDCVLVAHNSSFDMAVLRDSLLENDIIFPDLEHYCSMRIARKMYDSENHKLNTLCDYLGIRLDRHHRAGDDAAACAGIFLRELEDADVDSIDQLQERLGFSCGCFRRRSLRFESQSGPSVSKKSDGRSARNYFAHGFNVNINDIVGNPAKADPQSPFFGKAVCLTGSLSYGDRATVLQALADLGATPMNTVTRRTDILVVGKPTAASADGISSKQRKALEMQQKGHDICILTEQEFMNLANLPNP